MPGSPLQQNPPNKRLQYIAKIYGGRYPGMVMDMVDVIARTVGEDGWRTKVQNAGTQDRAFAVDMKRYGLGPMTPHESRTYERPSPEFVDAVVALTTELTGFRRPNAADPLFPWMATQLGRELKKDSRNGDPLYAGERYRAARHEFLRRGTALAQWFQGTRPDLTKLVWQEALREMGAWQEEQADDEDVPQGDVVYEFDDGWTVQQLETSEQLDAEGEVMQHCVGGGDYCEAVEHGRTEIYSVRDAKGRPHATIEFDPSMNFVKQVQGKQNQPPVPEYQKRVDEFLASDTLPDMDPATKEIYDALEQHSDTDEESIAYDVARWLEEFGGDAAEWIGAGFSYDIEEALLLRDADVTTEELSRWPMVAWDRWRHIRERGIEDPLPFVRLMRIAMMIEASKRESTASDQALGYAKQLDLPLVDSAARFETLARQSAWKWMWDDSYGDELREYAPILVQAERWADTALDFDDVEGWHDEFFSPGVAEAWDDVGVEPRVASALRAERVTPRQVEAALDGRRLSDRYPSELRDVDKVLRAVGVVAANRRRTP